MTQKASHGIPGVARKYTAAILIIGNEILSGRTQDVNVKFIAERLGTRGITLTEVRVVRDDEEAIGKAVNELRQNCDYVFTTGGIGPTHDDITVDCIAKAFGVPVNHHPEAVKRLESYYAATGTTMNEARLRMTRVPEGGTLIDNPISAAPGIKIENVYIMAGIPDIMQAMFTSIENKLAGGAPMPSATVTCHLREGNIAKDLEHIQKQFPDIEIGSYPFMQANRPCVSFVLRGTDHKKLDAATSDVEKMVRRFDDIPQTTHTRPA